MDFEDLFESKRERVAEAMAEPIPEELVRVGNAAYGAGLSLLMLGRDDEACAWLDRAAQLWRESWEHASPVSWGRPIGAIKATLIAEREPQAEEYAEWALALGCETAESPIGRYAASLALLTLERWPEARRAAETIRGLDDFPPDVAEALWAIAAGDAPAYAAAVESIVTSFETREAFLEDVAVADTALALQALAARRGIAAGLGPSPVLPG